MSPALGAAALVVLLGVVGCSSEPEAERDDTGAVASQGAVDVTTLAVGDCVNDPDGTDSEEGVEITSIEAVPCDQPHDNEVFHVFDLPDGDYPGDEAIEQTGGEGCLTEFEGFVGLPYEESTLEIAPITPTEGAWADGDRSVQCIVYDPEGAKVTGTLENAER